MANGLWLPIGSVGAAKGLLSCGAGEVANISWFGGLFGAEDGPNPRRSIKSIFSFV